MNCNWTITVIPGYYVYLHFEHFHLESAYGNIECPYDYVEIFDGNSSSSSLISKRCDYQDSWCVYSSSNVLHVNFVSDFIVAHSGFTAYYEKVYKRYPMCLYLNASKYLLLLFVSFVRIGTVFQFRWITLYSLNRESREKYLYRGISIKGHPQDKEKLIKVFL